MKLQRRYLVGSFVFYLVWVAATWYFEGRIQTLLRPDAVADRIGYALVVNLLFGVFCGIVFLRLGLRRGAVDAIRSGFAGGRRTAVAVVAGVAIGLAAYVLQGAPSLDPVVVLNAYCQVFVVSAAEIVVCWSLVGAAAESAWLGASPGRARVLAAVLASVLFGLYHYAHSAPFNTLPMVSLLSVVGLVTSAFFFVSRDLAATVVFHNFLGTFGVVQALVAARAIAPLQLVQWPLIGTALVSAGVLAAGYALVRPVRA